MNLTFQKALLPLLPGERRRSAQLWQESNSPCLLPVAPRGESESGGSTCRLSKKLHLFPRKWARHRHPLLVCGQQQQPVGRNAALHIYLCCCTPDSVRLTLHCIPQCAVLCTAVCAATSEHGRLPVFCASRRSSLAVCAQRAPPGSREQAG